MLQVTLGADWETIEKSRRDIVQKSHPDASACSPPESSVGLVIEHRAPGPFIEAIQILLGLRIQEETCASQLHETTEPEQERALLRMSQVNR